MKCDYIVKVEDDLTKQTKIVYLTDIVKQGTTRHTQLIAIGNDELAFVFQPELVGDTLNELLEEYESVKLDSSDNSLVIVIDDEEFNVSNLSKTRCDKLGIELDGFTFDVFHGAEAEKVVEQFTKNFKVDLSELLEDDSEDSEDSE